MVSESDISDRIQQPHISIYCTLSRLLPKLISVIVAKKFKITIRFGRIGLPFTLLNVEICKNGYSVVCT